MAEEERVIKMRHVQSDVLDYPRARRRKGIYLLPNLLTTGALFCGFYAVLTGFGGQHEWACMAVFIALFFDGLDGKVARLTQTESDFGAQYDSLADMVSFGVAPAVIAYGWGLSNLGKLGLAAAFVFTSCAALRLARFNVQSRVREVSFRNFIGLPSPAAAALVVGLVWSTHLLETSVTLNLIGALITVSAGLLMVSSFKYPSFKQIDFRGRVPFFVIFCMVMAFVLISIDPPRILFMVAVFFCFYAPARWAWDLFQSKFCRHTSEIND
jgi:CDP-diacylglycerol--serine O-phosphatidyltransferase